ncbi:MAG: hypothetical protein ACYTFW_12525 [Planctomycetota bacterium]|jgi:hypothetical protein
MAELFAGWKDESDKEEEEKKGDANPATVEAKTVPKVESTETSTEAVKVEVVPEAKTEELPTPIIQVRESTATVEKSVEPAAEIASEARTKFWCHPYVA